MDRKAIFTGNNNDSVPFISSVPAGRPGGLSYMLASGDLERRLASSESSSVRHPILIITDRLDICRAGMNKGVGAFAG